MEDGDNEGSPHPDRASFIHLDKYCLESYLLDVPTAAKVTGISEDLIRSHLLDAVLANKGK
ncbi:hypothetical protein NL529_32245, partial [Klebsiella pneumoniae]|nr:hypothetical protein [Klebsiella pneumoniae]